MCSGQSQTAQSLPLAAERVADGHRVAQITGLSEPEHLPPPWKPAAPMGPQQCHVQTLALERHGNQASDALAISELTAGTSLDRGSSPRVSPTRTACTPSGSHNVTHEDPPARHPAATMAPSTRGTRMVPCHLLLLLDHTTINIKSFHRRGNPIVNKHEKTISLTARKHFKLKQQNIFK